MTLAIIGDFNPDTRSHIATNAALQHAAQYLGIPLNFQWIPTDTIRRNFEEIVRTYDAFWIAPGGPYNDVNAALDIIQYARMNNKPTIGTCGGFQHMVLEYARNVMGIKDAAHAEYDSDAPHLVISPLSCNLKGSPLEITITDETSKVFRIYGTKSIIENYYCNYGVNQLFQYEMNDTGFQIVGTDSREARILELKNHVFYIATLFVPQINSTFEAPHKLITAFLKAGM
jgi:CTP synthase (UTP-ammonia lyase)